MKILLATATLEVGVLQTSSIVVQHSGDSPTLFSIDHPDKISVGFQIEAFDGSQPLGRLFEGAPERPAIDARKMDLKICYVQCFATGCRDPMKC